MRSRSVDRILATNSLVPASPGTMALVPSLSVLVASSDRSSRRPALRFLWSGPWQRKQLLARIGWMSRAYWIFRGTTDLADAGARFSSARSSDRVEQAETTTRENARSRFMIALVVWAVGGAAEGSPPSFPLCTRFGKKNVAVAFLLRNRRRTMRYRGRALFGGG